MTRVLLSLVALLALAGCAAPAPQARVEEPMPLQPEPDAAPPMTEPGATQPASEPQPVPPPPEAAAPPPETASPPASGGSALVPNDAAPPPAPAPTGTDAGAPVATVTSADVMRAVDGLPGLDAWTVIPFAHFRRGARHAVVAWPAINSSGQLVDATVVGICLAETGPGALEQCGRRWVVRDARASRAALVEALGGDDYEVLDRSAGTSLNELGARLSRLGSDFVDAMDAGDRAGARRAAADFARMLPLDRVSFENGAAQLLWAAATHHGRLELADTVRRGDTATLTFNVLRGRQRFRTIEATARRVAGSADSWVFESYR
jgi:hypothetical protein